MEEMTTTFDGRVYRLVRDDREYPALSADLKRRGWDGYVYNGTAEPVGRQRKTFFAMFYRDAKTGAFMMPLYSSR